MSFLSQLGSFTRLQVGSREGQKEGVEESLGT